MTPFALDFLSFSIGCGVACFVSCAFCIVLFMAKGQKNREQLAAAQGKIAQLSHVESVLGTLQVQHQKALETNAELSTHLAHERENIHKNTALLQEAQKHLSHSFQALSLDALQKNNQTFLQLAQHSFQEMQERSQQDFSSRQKEIASLVTPVKEALSNVDKHLHTLETERMSTYQVLRQQIQDLNQTHQQLRAETVHLTQALKTPTVRGRWGEMQLKRVVEMAGMLAYCDFFEQVNVNATDQKLRPDMVIQLPGGKQIIVDAKAPLHAYLEAIEISDEELRRQKMLEHTKQVRQHILTLGRRAYWEQFDPTPDFVVLFLPGEMFFSAALQSDPSLIEAGVQEKVVLTTPTTLIAMLRAIHYGWRQEQLADNAREIGNLGQEVYKRLSDLGQHFGKLGRHLNQTVDSYNNAIGTLERRVLVTARKFENVIRFSDTAVLPDSAMVDQTARLLTAPELLSQNGEWAEPTDTQQKESILTPLETTD